MEYNWFLETESAEKWSALGLKRRAGIMVPLFSAYSDKSVGIGDFADIDQLVSFCTRTGNSILQLLPMNDTGNAFCPYDAASSFALDPVYLALRHHWIKPEFGFKQRNDKGEDIKVAIEKLRQRFTVKNAHVDYGIKEAKLDFLRQFFSGEPLPSEFYSWCRINSFWLEDYAMYKAIQKKEGNIPWEKWQAPLREKRKEDVSRLGTAHKKEILFNKWIQWLAYKQMSAAHKHAKGNNVLLMGDLPIFVARDSADVWAHREFFNLDFAAGAPPDMYSARGQRWGMPIYRWEEIAAQNFRYICEKLLYAQNFYDILRIDHVVGLFRIWAIPVSEPPENKGLNGSFIPPEESAWEGNGLRILRVMNQATGMLLCAEDLGIVPEACPSVLSRLGIPGMSVQRWMRDWAKTKDFLTSGQYPQLSVATLSLHDTSIWSDWWQNEAGTVDYELFEEKCTTYNISAKNLIPVLFNLENSSPGRLRWKHEISSPEDFCRAVGRRQSEIQELLTLYLDTYMEREKCAAVLGIRQMDLAGREYLKSALMLTFNSPSIFCIQLLLDWLDIAGMLPQGRIFRYNTPGTLSPDNWSLRLPCSIKELEQSDTAEMMREMVRSSGRIMPDEQRAEQSNSE